MSNSPVDTGETYEGKPVEGEDVEEESSPTLAAFRISSDSVMFYKRMAQNFYEGGLTNASIHSIADSLGITHGTLYNTIIPEFLNIYDAASKQKAMR